MEEGVTMGEVIFREDGHRYFLDGKEYPSVTTILKHFGLSDLSMVNKTILEESAEFGKNFHATAALYEEGSLGAYSPEFEPWLNGWKKFLAEIKPEVVAIEIPMVSKVWGFSGTPDRIYKIKGKMGIWDIKTGHEMKANKYQTAGYAILAEENLGLKIKERGTICVLEDGYKLYEHKNLSDVARFQILINTYKIQRLEGVI
jgi:hypothetical protein